MAIEGQDFEIYQGDVRAISFTILDEAGAAVDITAATFVWYLAKVLTEPATITKHGPGGGGTIAITDASNGILSVPLVENDTKTLQEGWEHQLVMTLGGEIKTVAVGTITILPSSAEH